MSRSAVEIRGTAKAWVECLDDGDNFLWGIKTPECTQDGWWLNDEVDDEGGPKSFEDEQRWIDEHSDDDSTCERNATELGQALSLPVIGLKDSVLYDPPDLAAQLAALKLAGDALRDAAKNAAGTYYEEIPTTPTCKCRWCQLNAALSNWRKAGA